MPNYRRLRVPGATYFFTVTLADRRSTVLTDRIDLLCAAFRETLRAALPARHLPLRLPYVCHTLAGTGFRPPRSPIDSAPACVI